MELDELKELWSLANRRLEATTRLNALLLQQGNLRKAAGSLRGLSRGLVAELILTFVGVLLLGSFAADHLRESRFFVPAVVLGIYAIALFAANLRQAIEINGVDYDDPVVAIQAKLERLRLLRIRTMLATLLFAPLMWVPLLVVALRAFGVDVFAVTSTAWLAANLVFGLALIPLAIWIARRYQNRLGRSGLIRSLADAIAGRSLTGAIDSLDTIRRFGECDSTNA